MDKLKKNSILNQEISGNSRSVNLLINITSESSPKNYYNFKKFEKTETFDKVIEYITTSFLDGDKDKYIFNFFYRNSNVDYLRSKYRTLGELLQNFENNYVIEDSDEDKIVILVYRNGSEVDFLFYSNGLPSFRLMHNEKNRVIDEIVRKNELSVINLLNDESNLQSKIMNILISTVPDNRLRILKEICESLNNNMFNHDLPTTGYNLKTERKTNNRKVKIDSRLLEETNILEKQVAELKQAFINDIAKFYNLIPDQVNVKIIGLGSIEFYFSLPYLGSVASDNIRQSNIPLLNNILQSNGISEYTVSNENILPDFNKAKGITENHVRPVLIELDEPNSILMKNLGEYLHVLASLSSKVRIIHDNNKKTIEIHGPPEERATVFHYFDKLERALQGSCCIEDALPGFWITKFSEDQVYFEEPQFMVAFENAICSELLDDSFH
jgi:hypothetical protein